MICPQCKAVNRDGAKFCDECGTRLIPADKAEAENAGDQEPVAVDEEAPAPKDDPSFPQDADASELSDDAAQNGEVADAPEPQAYDIDEALDSAASEQDEDQGENGGPETSSEAGPSDSDKTAVIDLDHASLPSEASQTRRIDLSGFDEFAVPGSYSIPAPSWRDGGTMRLPRIEEAPATGDQKSFRAPKKKRKGVPTGVKIAIGIVTAIVVCAAVALFATYQMEIWGGKNIPDVVGMTQADATNTLESKGFAVRSTQVKSDETEGIVLLMDPTSGSRLDEGGEVIIHVATARSIPQIVGMQRPDAESALGAEGLSNVTFVTERSDEAEGSVLSVDPAEGEKVRAGTAVTVTIAEPYTVPSVDGMSQDDAKTAVQDAGYNAIIDYVYNEDVAEGTVLGTDPAEGERVPSGSDVAIQVALSRATELVNATYYIFSEGNTVTIDGVSYTVNSCDSATFQGSETTAYTITATPFTYFLGVYLPLDARSVSGTITWNSDNSIASASPSISVG